MKSVALFLCLFFVSGYTFCQTFRLHAGGGFANYLGDLQQKRLSFGQIKGMYVFGAAYDINDHISIRIDYSHAQVGADDKKSNKIRFVNRNLNFQTAIKEVALVGEYCFPNAYTAPFVPYAFGGLAVFKFNPYTFDSVGRMVILADLSTEGQGLAKYPHRKKYKRTQFNIPVGAGFKYHFTDNIFISGEGGVRKLFTDYLDDVSLTYVDESALRNARGQLAVDLAYRSDELPPHNRTYPKDGSQRGNKDKDWYYFAELKINVILGWNSNGSSARGWSRKGAIRRLGCPMKF